MHPRHFDDQIIALQEEGLEVLPAEFAQMARMSTEDLDLILRIARRALIVGTPATPATVVRYRGPDTCPEQLAAPQTRGRHAKDGAANA